MSTVIPTSSRKREEELVRAHMDLVYRVARRLQQQLASSGLDDLVSAGLEGLFQAARSYDPERGVLFRSYARHRIRGAMLDDFRSTDPVGRHVRPQVKNRQAVVDRLVAELGRLPTTAELAAATGLRAEKLRELAGLAQVSCTNTEDLDVYCTSEPGTDPEAHVLRRDEQTTLVMAVGQLPDQLRQVVLAHYLDEMSLREISRQRGVSESRISQLVSDALALLAGALGHGDVTRFSQQAQEYERGWRGERYRAVVAEKATTVDLRDRLSPDAGHLERLAQ